MTPLTDYPPLTAEEAAFVVHAVACALADQHRAGQVHGSVGPEHIGLDNGVVTLIAPQHATPGATPAADVTALLRLGQELLPSEPATAGPPLPWPRRGLALALQSFTRLRAGRPRLLDLPPAAHALAEITRMAAGKDGPAPSAASIAALVAARIPTARPPGRQPPPPNPSPRRRAAARLSVQTAHFSTRLRRLTPALGIAALLVSGGWYAQTMRHRTDRPPERSPDALLLAAPTTAPSASRVWPAAATAAVPDAVITTHQGRFSVGHSGDVVVQGDWFCRGQPLPALLRPSRGDIYIFDRWPDQGADVRARRVGTVPGGVTLRASDRPGPACSAVTAVRADGSAVSVSIPGEASG
jgi:hypothetical protein